MANCKRSWTLEVYQRDPRAGLSPDNALVLCLPCYETTPAFADREALRRHFPRDVQKRALAQARNRCQCTACEECRA